MNKITREEAIKELKSLQEDNDYELMYIDADDVLCRLLISLGYADVVKEWEKVERKYI